MRHYHNISSETDKPAAFCLLGHKDLCRNVATGWKTHIACQEASADFLPVGVQDAAVLVQVTLPLWNTRHLAVEHHLKHIMESHLYL